MTGFSKRTANEQLNQEADKVHRRDVGALLDRQQAIEDKVRNSGKLSRFSTDIRLMFSMLRDYWQGNYREVPWKSIAAIAGALVYVLNPLDLIPDLLLGFACWTTPVWWPHAWPWWNPTCFVTLRGKILKQKHKRLRIAIDSIVDYR